MHVVVHDAFGSAWDVVSSSKYCLILGCSVLGRTTTLPDMGCSVLGRTTTLPDIESAVVFLHPELDIVFAAAESFLVPCLLAEVV